MTARRITGWRRVANAMWRAPNDPQIYGALDVDAAPLLAFIDRARRAGHRVTPTHLVGRAIARALDRVPELNVRIRRGRAHPRGTIDVFFIAAVASGGDLSGVKVRDVGARSAIDVAEELARRATAMKRGDDPDLARTKAATDAMPPWLLRRMLRLTAFLTEDLRLDVPWLGLRREPFGSAMVTSVGAFGVQQGFAPLAWMYDVPLLILVGELAERAVAAGGKVSARTILPITATIDHRYVDGWHVSRAMQAFRDYLEDPQAYEPVASVAA
ncbi:MAG: 2-oxo acid dehydrogenase subunit E2 [Deltaproteobacteria bacterium]|nr:2-oxo acid dehydrogenase subunit E2 [Deltaproteobacteria bacterium]